MTVSFRRFVAPIAFASLAGVLACHDNNLTDALPTVPRGIIVMDGFIQPGYTLLPDTGTATARIALGTPAEFDGDGFVLQNDTALAVSSRGAGDLLFVTDLRAGTVRKIQLPAASNPSRARLVGGGNGSARILVALRDSQAIATVAVSGGGVAVVTLMVGAGQCPTDVFRFENATWVVDANANCRTNYAVQGAVRLIRIPDAGTTRDTIALPSLRGSGATAIVTNGVAYVSAGGDANFASFPYTLVASGAIAKVDLRARRVLVEKTMPSGTYGASTKLGLDGNLYVSLYQDLNDFTDRVLQLRADDLTYMNHAVGSDWRTLTTATGAPVTCTSATADALGRVHCLVSGAASATSLVVFDPAGREFRRVSAGQGGIDLALRP